MELLGKLWQSFMDAPDYSEYSPWFPNPLICTRDIVKSEIGAVNDCLSWKGMEDQLYLNFSLDLNFIIFSFIVAIMLTVVRVALNFLILERIPIWFSLSENNAAKFPMSTWKLFFYIVTWLWALYLIVKQENNYFFDLQSHWKTWHPGEPIDPALTWLYILQMGFYLHYIYSTPSNEGGYLALMLHHFLTIALLIFSYAMRFHRIGLLTIFLHDFGDIYLELSKTLLYFRIQGGKKHRGPEVAANFTFATFTLQFILFRLYWFPVKVCYSANHVSLLVLPSIPCWTVATMFLWVLFAIQVYWSTFAVRLLWKILTKGVIIEDTQKEKNLREQQQIQEEEEEDVMVKETNGVMDNTDSSAVRRRHAET